MKHHLLSITAGLLITGTCIWLAGCKKEINQSAVNTDKTITKQSEADRITEQRIRSFRTQAKTNARINENMTAADALWYLESTLNYTFCRGSRGIIDPLADTAMVTLTETAAGMVEFNDVASQYNNIAAQMQANVPVLEQNKRTYMLVDVMDLGSNNSIITFRCIMLNGGIPDTTVGNGRVANWTGFGPDDNWYYGEMKGRQNANGTTQYVNQYDATTVLTNAINTGVGSVIPWLPNEPGEYYFNEVTTVTIHKEDILNNYQVPNQPLNNINDYYIFYKSKINNNNIPLQNQDLLIKYSSYDEMNFYYLGLKNVVKAGLDAQFASSNKVMKCCKVNYFYFRQNSQYIEIFHPLVFEYGVKHVGAIPD